MANEYPTIKDFGYVGDLVNNVIGSPIASAATIAPVRGVHHVTGVAAIVNITLPWEQFSGTLKLIADGLWSWTAAGNINAAGSISAVGQVLELVYDNTNGKFYPQLTGVGGGSLTVGSAVSGGVANAVLFEDGSQNLAANAQFKFTTAGGLQVSDSGANTNVTIGSNANAAVGGTGGTNVVVGNGATVGASNPAGLVMIGSLATASGSATDSIGIGRAATPQASNVIVIGAAASANGSLAVVVGNGASATGGNNIALGTSSVAAVNEFVAGSANSVINNAYFGKGKVSTTATAFALNGTGGSGADNVGGNLVLASGSSTGAGAPASVRVQSTLVAGSSSTPQALVDTAIYLSGWQQLQRGMIALNANYTNATAGFTVTNLSATVVSGRTYMFTCVLFFSDSTSADGAQFDFNGGTAGVTNFITQASAFNNVGGALVLTNGATTALATAIQVTLALTTQTCITIQGSLVPSSAGTFIVRAAQTAHSTGTLTVNRGSFLSMTDVVAV